MQKKEYLNEEQYQKNKKKLITISIVILIVGVLIGCSIIAIGLVKQSKINEKYSADSKAARLEKLNEEKAELTGKLKNEKKNVINAKAEIENKIKPVEEQIVNLQREK